MSETAATIQLLAQAAALLENVTGAEQQVKILLIKINLLSDKVIV